MMPFEFGDVVLVPFSFTNQNALKQPQALIASSMSYNRDKPDIGTRWLPVASRLALKCPDIGAVTAHIAAPSMHEMELGKRRELKPSQW